MMAGRCRTLVGRIRGTQGVGVPRLDHRHPTRAHAMRSYGPYMPFPTGNRIQTSFIKHVCGPADRITAIQHIVDQWSVYRVTNVTAIPVLVATRLEMGVDQPALL